MEQSLDKIPDDNYFRSQAIKMLDVQLPGTTGEDREQRIATLMTCLRTLNELSDAVIMLIAVSPDDIIEGSFAHE